jgi:hypothetical protein
MDDVIPPLPTLYIVAFTLYYDNTNDERKRIIRSIKQPSAVHCPVSNNRLLDISV